MKHSYFKVLIAGLFFTIHTSAQHNTISAEFNYFFDNTEFAGSSYTIPQTMTGMHLIPQVHMRLDGRQNLIAGLDLLMLSGSSERISDVMPLVYYQYKSRVQRLLIGSFPRSKSVQHYSEFLIQDSVHYYRPNLHGLFWEIGNNKRHINIWLDWTGNQSATVKESFFVGLSGRYDLGKGFFADFQSYMFHLANTSPKIPHHYVSDNIQGIANIGYHNRKGPFKSSLTVTTGLFAGFERERATVYESYTPLAFVSQALIETKRFGLGAKLYLGDGRMKFYDKYSNTLYWGNPLLQSGQYLQGNAFWRFLNNRYVQGRINYKLHFSEGKIFHEQSLFLSATLNRLSKHDR
jgi:hypothetical protein